MNPLKATHNSSNNHSDSATLQNRVTSAAPHNSETSAALQTNAQGDPGSSSGRVAATFNGVPFESQPGISIAAALVQASWTTWRHSPAGHPRGMYCGIGVCHECAITVNGAPGIRACMVPIEPDMCLTSGDIENHPHTTQGKTETTHESTTKGGDDRE